ncbi:MAG: replication initiator protein [Microvirus sp.]|nr:MAG: replication initiator protein [Microvirus sp.]
MPCNAPLPAWQPPTGGKPLFGKLPPAPGYIGLMLPCGQCAGCRLHKSQQWAMRCVHEAQTHRENCFITLTYSDEHLPLFGSLQKSDLTKFLKRLRHHRGPFRFYACGEYGDRTQRAHYHACIFGLDFPDKLQFRKIGEHVLYVSEELNQIWGHGNTSIGSLTFETAAYTARYVMKKQTGKTAKPYTHLDPETGELTTLTQPYAVMSLRKAIAKEWLEKYYADIYNKDYVVLRGKKMPAARYYDKLYDKINPEKLKQLKALRVENSDKLLDNQLRARELNVRAASFSRKQV